ncbi:MAG: hypothetical protein RI968_840 [Pseudomonadota bacterium]|jgi:hypothetical protein
MPSLFKLKYTALSALIIFASLSVPSQAQVTYRFIAEEPPRVKHFLDIDRVDGERTKSEDRRLIWRLTNLIERSSIGAMSTRTREEINCKSNEIRSMLVVSYAGTDGAGQIIASLRAENLEWRPIAPGKLDARLAEWACAMDPRPPPKPVGAPAKKDEKK